MELFSEIYGVYYSIVEDILCNAPLSRSEIQSKVSGSGFAESVLHLIPKLLDEGAWPLLCEADGQWFSRLKHLPSVPVTTLEKRWLKAVLSDPRARLFLANSEISRLNGLLEDIPPLFDLAYFSYYDRYLDGDDYQDEEYIRHFHQILTALHNKQALRIIFKSGLRGKTPHTHQGDFVPVKLEYSEKDDKFRAYCINIHRNKPVIFAIINVGRILTIEESSENYSGGYDLDAWFARGRCEEPVIVEVSKERNAIERFMIEFSAFEKKSSFDDKQGVCSVRIWYPKMDETEVLIRILSFGPTVKVIGPDKFVEQLRQRVLTQQQLIAKVE